MQLNLSFRINRGVSFVIEKPDRYAEALERCKQYGETTYYSLGGKLPVGGYRLKMHNGEVHYVEDNKVCPEPEE